MIERGDAAHDLTIEIEKVLKAVQDAAGPKTAAKGNVTLKLNFEVSGVNLTIDAEITSKVPKRPRGKSMYFLTGDGEISTEHPQQPDMFGPRDAKVAQQ
jgi:hypothetical protein